MIALHYVRQLAVLTCLLSLIACSNGRGSLEGAGEAPAPGGFTVGGSVSGLTGSGLVLQNNGAGDLAVSADGSFAFTSMLADGTSYNVTVLSQPSSQSSNPGQICTVANGSGTIAGGNVTNIAVTCAAGTFAVGGAVTGLSGSGLVLQNNGGDDLAIAADGSFRFAVPVAAGAAYSVTVGTQPGNPSQTCTIANATGTVGEVDVTNIAVTCVTGGFSIGGAVSGLAGTGLVLQNNGGDDLTLATDGSFAFASAVPSGTPYVVSVKTQPSNPSQACSVANATGVVSGGNVTNVAVTCTTSVFTIGGTVTGLNGAGLVLQKNGVDDLAIASNGSFTFATEQASGTSYEVTVAVQPVDPSQTCTVADGSATVGGASVRNVAVTCATNSFAISGAVSGLLGAGLVLQNNGGDDVGVESDGGFTFPTGVASAAAYNVTVLTQPSNPTQACTVANGTGTVGGADVTSVAVNCTTSEFTIGGTASGVAGSGLLLRNNGTDDLSINADGGFTFATALQSGSTYNITLATQPTNPTQTCTLSNASGTVGSTHVTNVAVTCVTTEFTVGGTVSGLVGSGLVLLNNGSDNLAIAADGAFTFPVSLPSGTPYNVMVATPPTGPLQLCGVANGSGTVSNANITDVAVNCITIGL